MPSGGRRQGAGRPLGSVSIEGEQIRMRLHASQLDAIDAWRANQQDKPSRAEAIRRLVDLGFGRAALAVPLCDLCRECILATWSASYENN